MDTFLDFPDREPPIDFIKNSPIPINWINGSGIIIWANRAELEMFGYKPEEYIGKHISKFHDDNALFEDFLRKLLDNEPVQNCSAKVVCRNGEIKDVLINANVYSANNRFIHSRCYTTDVTLLKSVSRERKENVEELEYKVMHIEQLYNKMVAEVEDYAIIMLDLDGTILNWNKGAERIKGYTEKEIVGQNFRIFYLPEDRQSGLPEKLILEAIKTGRAKHEGLRVRKNGNKFWGTIVITALHNDKGEVIGFTKVTRDLTDHEQTSHFRKMSDGMKTEKEDS